MLEFGGNLVLLGATRNSTHVQKTQKPHKAESGNICERQELRVAYAKHSMNACFACQAWTETDLQIVQEAWDVIKGPSSVKELTASEVSAWFYLILEHYEHTLQHQKKFEKSFCLA